MSDTNDDEPITIDMPAVNHHVAKQDFTALQKMIVNTRTVGEDIVIILAMCVMLNTEMKALREELTEMKRKVQ